MEMTKSLGITCLHSSRGSDKGRREAGLEKGGGGGGQDREGRERLKPFLGIADTLLTLMGFDK